MSEGRTSVTRHGPVARILFDRPQAYNALTWEMWRGLGEACAQIAADPEIRVVTLRGAGGKAFVSGTDIAGFRSFTGGDDGVAYEAEMDGYLAAVEALPQPTVAIVDGWAVGGGLALSFACDFRVAAEGARFGSPLARTVGNCLSARGYARLVQHAGIAMAKRMLLAAEMIPAAELDALGLLNALVPADALDAAADALVERLLGNAPVTLRASKEAMRRIAAAGQPDITDLIHQVYDSHDFRIGVAAFLGKQTPLWTGK
ncbi:enoyl-CoA hydratase [Sphingomonas quercus]|uniref:Enoyl-CoA hydratase/isomerase family protein n=1 Tax=Sphingomonas quercus TaxID=2842451 RepID=A0ABS6BLF2_9SPHN|nr:enoyl-CoA hydratase [Sphingomonas quercus]MBU3078596.1 enoyl-CoA hydratase/isomerase family protein [Sphingomonas quercus]